MSAGLVSILLLLGGLLLVVALARASALSRRRKLILVVLLAAIVGIGLWHVHNVWPARTARPHEIHLTWSTPTDTAGAVVSYNVYRSSDGGATFSKLTSSPETHYEDTAVQRGATYIYVIRSVNAKGIESGPSQQMSLTVP